MKVRIKAKYINDEVVLTKGLYADGATAIVAHTLFGEPMFKATVSVQNALPKQGCVFLKGWSENEGIVEELVRLGIVKLTGRTESTGRVMAQEAILLAEIGAGV